MFCTFFTVLCIEFESYEEKHRNFASGSGSNAENIIRYFQKTIPFRFRWCFLIKVMPTFWNVRIVWECPVTCFQRRTG